MSTDNQAEKGVYGHVSLSGLDELATAVVRDTHKLELDEPDWIPGGEDKAPCPVDYLCVAVAGCQMEVLKQGLAAARVEEFDIRIDFEREKVESDESPDPMPDRLSILVDKINLKMTVDVPEEYAGRARRVVDVCDDVCIVSKSVTRGIDVPIEKAVNVV